CRSRSRRAHDSRHRTAPRRQPIQRDRQHPGLSSPLIAKSDPMTWGVGNCDLITLLQDNLNIHAKSSLYQAFPAPEARRLVQRFEWVYTPKHGSWLDLAESELAVLSGQCLDRRIPNQQALE